MIQCIGYDKKRKAYIYKDTETGKITYEKDTEVEESIEEPIKLSNENVEPKQIYDPETMKIITNTEHIDKHHDGLTVDTWFIDDIASKSVFRPEDAVSATVKIDGINDMYEPPKIPITMLCIICNNIADNNGIICDSCRTAILELKNRLYSRKLDEIEYDCEQNSKAINDIDSHISAQTTMFINEIDNIKNEIQILKENNKHE